MVSTDNRIEILTESEINDLYAVPNLSEAEREEYFVLHGDETTLYSPRNEPIIAVIRSLVLIAVLAVGAPAFFHQCLHDRIVISILE